MMRCELRDHEADSLAILPIPKPDGSLITVACLDHARESDYFCLTHDRPHTGFRDSKSHACLHCIEENVEEMRKGAGFYADELKRNLTTRELHRLQRWVAFVTTLTGQPEEICILRAVLTTAACRHLHKERAPIETVIAEAREVLEEAVATKSAEEILPREVSDLLGGETSGP